MDYTIREGNYEKLGVQKKDDAVIFTLVFDHICHAVIFCV